MGQELNEPEHCPGKGVGVRLEVLAPCGSADFHRPHEIAPPGTSAEELIAQANERRRQVPALIAEHRERAAAAREKQIEAVEKFEAWRADVDRQLADLKDKRVIVLYDLDEGDTIAAGVAYPNGDVAQVETAEYGEPAASMLRDLTTSMARVLGLPFEDRTGQ